MTASTAATRTGGPGRAAPSGTLPGLGFCRVTIVAPDSRIDVALPDDVPVADVYPEILRLSRQTAAEGAPVGYHLVRRDGTVLDSSRSFAAQRILDGELLTLRPFAESLPPAVVDDVSEAVASAVTRDRSLWHGDLTRAAGLVVGGGVLPALVAFVAWNADPRHDMHGLPGILAGIAGVLLVVLGCVRARVYDDRAAAVALGLGALPNMGVAGSGLLSLSEGQGVGKLQFLLACAAVLVASVILALVSPQGDGPFVAFVAASGLALAATFVALLRDWTPAEIAALCAPVAVGALAFLPGLSMRFARLPIGFEAPHTTSRAYGTDPEPHEPVDAERIEAQARRGHELLVGLVGGCSLLAAGSVLVLSFSGGLWALLLALATGIALLMRAQLFRYTAQVATLLAAGLGSLVALGLGLALNPPDTLVREALTGDRTGLDIRTIWLIAAIAAVSALVTAIGLVASRSGLTPFWGRFLEIAEGFVLLTLVPLALAVFDVYTTVRSMTG
ncbi:type VII secretion integral membrane protein EccD [Streptomyces sp. NPDC055186]